MEPEKKSNGAFIGLAIIIIILVIGGIYAWQSKVKYDNGLKQPAETVTTEDQNSLDSLDQEANTLDSNVGVDVDNLK